MKRLLAIILAVLGWMTLLIRLVLRMQTEGVEPSESFVQFFSYFTILTNFLVTLYFTNELRGERGIGFLKKPSAIGSLTVFISIVGLVYHLILKPIWKPEGFTMILSEIHHTVVPAGTLIYWLFFKAQNLVRFKSMLLWLIYPVLYLSFVIWRGGLSGFYPYPFLNVGELGLEQVLINSAGLLGVMIAGMGMIWLFAWGIAKIT
jgi:hypothetical protein